MNKTIDYYNNNAEQYYQATLDADLEENRKRFASYLPAGARIIDIGCGSGRDIVAFRKMGFNAVGLDASEELAQLAKERLGITVIASEMSTWKSDEPYDGIWCCASLMHLTDNECKSFANNLHLNLKPGGILYISVKEGIETGTDAAGRYFKNFTEDEIKELVTTVSDLELRDIWYTEDTLKRNDFRWLNVIAQRKKR